MNKADEFTSLNDDELDEVYGGVNWSVFGQKALGKVDQNKYPELIAAIARRDWVQVAQIAIPLLGKGDRTIDKCADDSREN